MALIDIMCMVAAALFLSANALKMFIFSKNHNHYYSEFQSDQWKALDWIYLSAEWESYRLPQRTLTQAVAFTNSVAFITLAIPVVQVAVALSRSGTRHLGVHVLIGASAVAGSVMEATAGLITVGMDDSLDLMAKDFNMDSWTETSNGSKDGAGWMVLEMIHLAARGIVLWIDAFEWLALSLIFFLIFWSVYTSRRKNKLFCVRWAVLGLICGVTCSITFVCEIIRFKERSMLGNMALVAQVIGSIFLIPLWLIQLSFMLPVAKLESRSDNDSEEETIEIRRNSEELEKDFMEELDDHLELTEM